MPKTKTNIVDGSGTLVAVIANEKYVLLSLCAFDDHIHAAF
jgi:hypothetical protein